MHKALMKAIREETKKKSEKKNATGQVIPKQADKKLDSAQSKPERKKIN